MAAAHTFAGHFDLEFGRKGCLFQRPYFEGVFRAGVKGWSELKAEENKEGDIGAGVEA